MTRTRKVLAWVVGLFALLVAVLVVLIATFDWNRLKPTINTKVSEILHRPFAINGNLAVQWQREPDEGGWRAWVPWPHVIAEDLTLGNPEWSKTPQMASLNKVEARLSPLALLTQTVAIPRIDLVQPSADLVRLADGRANWTFTFDPKDPDAEPSNWTVDIGAIKFDKGHVTLNDQTLKTRLDVVIDPLGKPIPFSEIVGEKEAKKSQEKGAAPQDYAFALKVKGQYHGQNLDGTGKIGGLLALQDANQPFPLQAQVSIADTKVALAGTLTDPLNLGALDLRLKLAGSSLSNLYPLTGVTLPDSPPYSTDGHLIAKLHEPGGAVFTYENFNGKIGNSDIHGDLKYAASQPRPTLSGKLVSNQLLMADLGPLIGVDNSKSANAPKASGGASKQPAGKVLPAGRQGAAGGGIPYRALARHGRRRGIHRQTHRAKRRAAVYRSLHAPGVERWPIKPGTAAFRRGGRQAGRADSPQRPQHTAGRAGQTDRAQFQTQATVPHLRAYENQLR